MIKAYEVIIIEPRWPWLRWRRLAPRWLQYAAAVRSREVAIAEAEWWGRNDFDAERPADAFLSCRGLEQLPPNLVPHGKAAGPYMDVSSYDRGHGCGCRGSLEMHPKIQAPPLPSDGFEGHGVREPLRPKPGSGAAGARRPLTP